MNSPVSYLLSVTASPTDPEVLLAIMNTVGRGCVFHGSSNELTNTALWIMPRARKNKKEVIEKTANVTCYPKLRCCCFK